jgi:hypothetical protein
MVIPYIYSTCWCMKLMFYEHQHPPEHEQWCVDVSCPGRTLNALCDPQIPLDAKTQVRITCPDALFRENAPGPPEHEK